MTRERVEQSEAPTATSLGIDLAIRALVIIAFQGEMGLKPQGDNFRLARRAKLLSSFIDSFPEERLAQFGFESRAALERRALDIASNEWARTSFGLRSGQRATSEAMGRGIRERAAEVRGALEEILSISREFPRVALETFAAHFHPPLEDQSLIIHMTPEERSARSTESEQLRNALTEVLNTPRGT